MDSVGEGEGGKIWENGIETCVISCMKQKTTKKKNLRGYSQPDKWKKQKAGNCKMAKHRR